MTINNTPDALALDELAVAIGSPRQRYVLRNGDKVINESTRALLFGALVGLTKGVVEFYDSDLYHDAVWIGEYVNGPIDFYFGCDQTGTAIGTDSSLVRYSRANVWAVELKIEGRYSDVWALYVTQIVQGWREV